METLSSGSQLIPGEEISSNNGYFALTLQQDGNVVLYKANNGTPVIVDPIWATGTNDFTPGNLIMQGDGNLVLYPQGGGNARWASGTSGNNGAFLNVENNGRIVIYRAGSTTPTRNNALWMSDFPPHDSVITGYYEWTYNNPLSLPPTYLGEPTINIAFSGYADPTWLLIVFSEWDYRRGPPRDLSVELFCTSALVAGNNNGYFTATILNNITNAINGGQFNIYPGIVFDIEEGDSNLANAFNAAFMAAKSKEMIVVVTTSHSGPYGIEDAAELMNSFFTNDYIDYLSPQLYTAGTETQNDFSASQNVPWSLWMGPNRPSIIPSVVTANLFSGTPPADLDGAANFVQDKLGLNVAGFFQWAQG
jgi:hypothetical protein